MQFRFQGITMGHTRDYDLLVTDYEAPETNQERSDVTSEGHDGTMPGRSYERETTWTFSVRSMVDGLYNSREVLSELMELWRSPDFRAAGVLVELDYRPSPAYEWRTVYGQPENISPYVFDHLMKAGAGGLTLQFIQMDPRTYGPVVNYPLSAGVSQLYLEGAVASSPVVRFEGPAATPAVTTDGWHVGLRVDLDEGDQVTVQPRDGQVLDRYDRNFPAYLDRMTRPLRTSGLAPGVQNFTVQGGPDVAVLLSYRPAYRGL